MANFTKILFSILILCFCSVTHADYVYKDKSNKVDYILPISENIHSGMIGWSFVSKNKKSVYCPISSSEVKRISQLVSKDSFDFALIGSKNDKVVAEMYFRISDMHYKITDISSMMITRGDIDNLSRKPYLYTSRDMIQKEEQKGARNDATIGSLYKLANGDTNFSMYIGARRGKILRAYCYGDFREGIEFVMENVVYDGSIEDDYFTLDLEDI